MNGSLYEKLRKIEKREWLAIAGVAGLVAACFLFRLGGVPLLGKDEPRYAEVAREMWASGDWITPRLAGVAWFEKPALPYWLMAAAYGIAGVSELAARLGSVLCATLGVVVVYLMSRRAAGPPRAAIAAAALATSALWLSFARGASFDMPLAATMTAALGSLYGYVTARSPRGRLGWAIAVGAWTGIAMLAKGLVGPLLIGLIVVAYLAASGDWRRVRAGDVAAAGGAAIALAATWYVPVWLRNGWPFVEEFFVNHHFRRYTSNKYKHPQPVYFYVLIVLGGFLPWTFLLLSGARRLAGALRRRVTGDDDRLLLLAAVWLVVPLVFFSFSGSKLPGYILPVFPALALLVAWAVERLAEEGKGTASFALTALAAAGLGIGLAVYAARELGAPVWEAVLVGVPLAAVAIFIPVARARLGARAAAWGVAAWSAMLAVAIAALLFGEVGRRESLRGLSAEAAAALEPGELVVLLGVVEYSPAFYVDGRMVVGEDGQILVAETPERVLDAARQSPTGSLLCITDEARAAALEADPRFRVTRVAAERDRRLLRVGSSL
jgi:4-amino-4-deoxy-L-arabinose transferase-like glycosyltransferase